MPSRCVTLLAAGMKTRREASTPYRVVKSATARPAPERRRIAAQVAEHDDEADQRADHAEGGSRSGHVVQNVRVNHGALKLTVTGGRQHLTDLRTLVACDHQLDTVIEEVILVLGAFDLFFQRQNTVFL